MGLWVKICTEPRRNATAHDHGEGNDNGDDVVAALALNPGADGVEEEIDEDDGGFVDEDDSVFVSLRQTTGS